MISALGRSVARSSRRLLSFAVCCGLAGSAHAVVGGDAVVSDAGASSASAAILDAASNGNRTVLTNNSLDSSVGLNLPTLVTVAPNGTVYYYDTQTSGAAEGIIAVNPATGARTLVSGLTTGTGPAFVAVSGLAWDLATASLIVSDSGTSAATAGILSVNPTTGNRTQITGNGTGSGAALGNPKFVAVATNGTIYYFETDTLPTNSSTDGVVAVNPANGVRTLISGGESVLGSGAAFVAVTGMTWDLSSATLLVSDAGGNSTNSGIIRVNPANGNRTFVTGGGEGGGVALDIPISVSATLSGTIYYYEEDASGTANSVIAVNPANGTRSILSGPTVGTGTAFIAPTAVTAADLAPVITNGTLTASGVVGLTFTTYTITAADSPASYSATGLPGGLSVNSANGQITGTPNQAGTFNATIAATNAAGTGTATLVVTISAPTLTLSPSSLPNTNVGAGYSQTISASGGAAPYSFVVSAGTPVPGLVLTNGGILSGTPTTAGTFTFTVKATDSTVGPDAPYTGTRSYTIQVAKGNAVATLNNSTQTYTGSPITLIATSVPTGLGFTYSYTGTGATVYGPTSTPPTAVGTYSVTATVSDPNYTGSATASLTISAPIVTLSPNSLPGGSVGTGYSQTLSAAGGTPSYTFVVTSGTPVPGLVLSSGGLLTGIPTTAGTYTFTVTATDSSVGPSAPFTGSQSYTVAITRGTALVSLSSAVRTYTGSPIALAATSTPPVAGFTYAYTGTGATAYGPSAAAPSAVGTYSVTATVNDPNYTGSATASLTISAPTLTVSPTTLPGSSVGASYTQLITATGGTAPYTFLVTAGTPVPGLTLSNGGNLTGSPTATGTFTFTVMATDSSVGPGAPFTGSRSYTVAVAQGTAVVTLANSTQTYTGSPIALTATSAPVVAGFTYSYTGTGGTVYGPTATPPTSVGTYAVTATVNDPNYTGSAIASLTISPVTLVVSPTTLPGSAVGASYSQTITASGGTPSYSFAVTSGTPVPGLLLSSGGVLSGVPTAAGTFAFTVTATDSTVGPGAPFTGSQSYTVVVSPGAALVTLSSAVRSYTGSPISLVAISVPPVAGFAYSYTGTGTTVYGPTAAAPSGVGTYAVTATVSDPNYTGSAAASLTISPATLTVSPSSLPSTATGASYSQTITAAGGTSPYTFLVTAGTPVPGLILSNAGVLAGTPTTVGTFTFTVMATDSSVGPGAPFTGSRSYTVVVARGNAVVTLASAALPYTGSPIALVATSAPVVAGFTYSYVGTGGTVYGPTAAPPTNVGTYAVTATVNDPNYLGSASASLTITQLTQTITFPTITGLTEGIAYTLNATASSGLPATFSIQSGNATLTGNSLKVLNLLPVTIVASQPGNATYSAASNVTQTVTATRAITRPALPASTSNVSPADGTAANPLVITPAAQTATAGSSPSLSVVTSGACQWQFNGVDLAGATGSTLTLPNIGTDQAGTYSVEVTNLDGSTDTASAVVDVIADPTTGSDPAPSP